MPQHAVQILPNSYTNLFEGHAGPQVFLESTAGKINHGQLPQDSYQPNYIPNQSGYATTSNFGLPQIGQYQYQQPGPHFEALRSAATQPQYMANYFPQFLFTPATESPKLLKQLGQNPVSYNSYQQDFGEHNSEDLVQKYQHTIQHDSYSNQQEESKVEDNTKLYSQKQNQYYSNQIPQDILTQYKDGLLLAPLIAHKQIGQKIPQSSHEKPLEYTNEADYQNIQTIQNYPDPKNYFPHNYKGQQQVLVTPYKLPVLPKFSKIMKPEGQAFETKHKQYIPENIKQQETNVEFQTLPNRLEHNYVIQKVNFENQVDEGPVKIVPAKQVKFMRPVNAGQQQFQQSQQNVARHQPQKLIQQQEYILQQYDPAQQKQSHVVEQQPKHNNKKPRHQPPRHAVKQHEQQSHTNFVQPTVPKKVVTYHYKQEEVSPYLQAQNEQYKTFEHMQQHTNSAPFIEYQMLSQPGLVNQLPMDNVNMQNLQQQKNVQQQISASLQSNNIIPPFLHNNLFSGGNLGYFNGGANNPDLYGLASQINNLGGLNLGTMRRSFKNVTTNPKPKNYRGKIKFVPDQLMTH